jgi:signal transduction histidine kinase
MNLKESDNLFKKMEAIANSKPEALTQKNYLDKFSSTLATLNAGILVKKSNKIIYESKSLNSSTIEGYISYIEIKNGFRDNFLFSSDPFANPFNSRNSELRYAPVELNNTIYKFTSYGFYFPNNDPGTIYMVSTLNQPKDLWKVFFSTGAILVGLFLILTNIALTFLVSKSIIKPLNFLKQAANEIKDGNLNFRIDYTKNDEVGEVCKAFEDMRYKLKESVDLQLQYENNRKELIANISHDLKTPITAIKGYVEGIMDGVADSPDKIDKYIKTIYTKSTDIDKLIDELFLFSKLDLNKLPFNFEVFDLSSFLEYCVEELSFDLEAKSIKLSFENNVKDKINVAADREKIKRVITNIIQNSTKYMDKESGIIKISLSSTDAEAELLIEDNGKGISKEALPFIFDRFYRADASRNRNTGGSGLGLAIAKRIIEGHGGRIWAESEPEKGTKICFTLKRAKDEQ